MVTKINVLVNDIEWAILQEWIAPCINAEKRIRMLYCYCRSIENALIWNLTKLSRKRL